MQQLALSAVNKRQKLADMLRRCSKNLLYDEGKRVHGALMRMGYDSDLMLNNDILNMYGKCGRVDKACVVFDRMPEKNVVSWTTLMRGYLEEGNAKDTLLLFRQMWSGDVWPNEFALSTSLKACGMLGMQDSGMELHALCKKIGFEWYPVVGNTVIDMYSRCGRIGDAERMFSVMPFRSLISWNVMIACYAQGGMGDKSLLLFNEMQKQGEEPDEFTFTSTLKACTGLGVLKQGTQVHAYLIVTGFPLSAKTIIAGALIDLYIKCGKLIEAHEVFNQVEKKSVVSWTALIIGYAQEGRLPESMDLFRQLKVSSIPVDGFVLSSMMGVFADFALVELGKQMHCYASKVPFGLDVAVANSIVDMYLKCGLTGEAERLFADMPEKNVVSWTVLITGYGNHGLGKKAIDVFREMQLEDVEPDDVTYLAVLSACSHSGLVEESRLHFRRLRENQRIRPRIEHYACMVDILGRSGRLKEAKHLIEDMPLEPNTGIWQALLSACRLHKDVELGREVGEILLRLDGNNPVNYVMLSNIYADARCWRVCEWLRRLAKAKGLRKEAGRSWVEIDKKIHFFYNKDETHPLTFHIHETLKEMEKKIKNELGYVHEVSFSLHDVDEESQEESLRVHSEKLAIGLALCCGALKRDEPIRIFKNLRVCGDCHEFIKGLSKVLQKIFLVRDANRFHKFENGICSCGDYW